MLREHKIGNSFGGERNLAGYSVSVVIITIGRGPPVPLGVNHSTVFRRIGAFEEELGVRLFERLPNGYLLTQAGEAMQEGALRVEDEIASLSRKVTGQDLRLSGTIRVTTLDMLAFGLLPRHLAKFRTDY